MKRIIFMLVIPIILALNFSVANAEVERTDGYYRVLDQNNNEITATALEIRPGDVFIAENNKMYMIKRIKGDNAYAKYVRTETAKTSITESFFAVINNSFSRVLDVISALRKETDVQAKTKRPIAIYHTHSDESYVPTSGKASKPGKGDIYKVGAEMASILQSDGVRVIHSYASHEPHDGHAYVRSRRTAIRLLRQYKPIALFDVHRDAVPAKVYQRNVKGSELAQVTIVVGRQNPNRKLNFEFAKQLKANADKKYPGLVKGIFWAHGNYNQDLGPNLLLLEFGTHTNSLSRAEKGAQFLTNVIPTTMAARAPGIFGRGGFFPGQGSSAWSTVGWLLLIAGLGIGLFLLIAAGGIGQGFGKVKQFFGREFANAIGDDSSKKEIKKDRGDDKRDN